MCKNAYTPSDFAALYASFDAPISAINCGERCAPHNEGGAPFCCDLRHAVPTAYQAEWEYLEQHTDLWHLWQDRSSGKSSSLAEQAPEGQVLIACRGHRACQRKFRSLTCRAFPFFPYITVSGEFVGLSYYWEYQDRCWVISNLHLVDATYRTQFVTVYDALFERMPEEREVFRYFSSQMRRLFSRKHRAIPLLHRNGGYYRITPRNGRQRRIDPAKLPKFGDYQIAAEMPFSDEILSSVSPEQH
ncbi:MAG: hypothetical protein B6D39_04245 [Anaerolineae bacterium UTCFX2]|jgi:hypothetical protein|nr:MAG: hypothetical protein B6D39_04245 [Anaerolineae bacterium UTCFX2]